MLVFIFAAVEAVLVRPVIAVFRPKDQPLGYPKFRGKGDFPQRLGRSRPGPVRVIEILTPQSQAEKIIEIVFDNSGYTVPFRIRTIGIGVLLFGAVIRVQDEA